MANPLIDATNPPDIFDDVRVGETFYARSSLWIKTTNETARGIDKLEFINGRYHTNPEEPCYVLNMLEVKAQIHDELVDAEDKKYNPPSAWSVLLGRLEAW